MKQFFNEKLVIRSDLIFFCRISSQSVTAVITWIVGQAGGCVTSTERCSGDTGDVDQCG